MTPRNPGGSIPIFIDIENLDLTFICGDQENYHENINDGFGSMGGNQKMRCDGCDDECGCYDDKDDRDNDVFENVNPVQEDMEAPCNTRSFSEECFKNSIEKKDNIFLDQILRKMAFIADVPISTAMMVLNAYPTLCSIFDEEPPVRFKKRKYDAHRIPIGLDDHTNRIHKAATALAYGLVDEEETKNGVKPSAPATQKDVSKKPTVAPTSEVKNVPAQEDGNDVLSLLPGSFKDAMKDAPEMMKKLVGLLSDKGNAVRIYRVEVMKNEETAATKDAGRDTTEDSGDGKEKVTSHE